MALSAEEVLFNEALGYVGSAQIKDTAASRLLKPNLSCVQYYDQARDEVLISHLWNEAMVDVIIPEEDDDPVYGYDKKYDIPTGALRIVSVEDSLGADQRNEAFGRHAWEVKGEFIQSNAGETPQTYAENKQYFTGEFFSATATTYVVGDSYVDGQFVKDGSLVYEVLADYTAVSISADITAGNLGTGVTGSTGTYSVVASYISDTVLTDLAAGDIASSRPAGRVVFVTYVQQLTDTTKWSSKLRQAVAMKLAIKIVVRLTNDDEMKLDLIKEFEELTMRKARSIDGAQGTARPIFNSEWIRSRFGGTRGRW